MMIHEVTERVGRYRARKRIGRGRSSGHGKTSGRGHKGAGSRAGFTRRPAREGGQLPFFRRIPKRGFSNVQFATEFHIVNLGQIQKRFENGADVNADSLVRAGLIRDTELPVKILGDGDFSLKVNVNVHKVSGPARERIEAAGGSVSLIEMKKWTRAEAEAAKKG
ncbi:MAG: 50S ribosomal protein L15 [Planctomycetota bacterium]